MAERRTETAGTENRRKKIFFVMGKSASGKDTIYKKILEQFPYLKIVIPYTTRPRREGEEEGVEYHFTEREILADMEAEGRVIEIREYETIYGLWSYATVDDGQIDLERDSYVMIGTLESYESIRRYFGQAYTVPIYIEVEDGERLQRALDREKKQKTPKYAELCRRFLADEKDFSEEKLSLAGIRSEDRYENLDISECLRQIGERIVSHFPHQG